MKKVCFCGILFLVFVVCVLSSIEKSVGVDAKCREKEHQFTLGLERFSCDLLRNAWPTCKSFRIGLITNQTGKSQQGERSVGILLKRGFEIKKIFTPEHGISGLVHTDERISNSIDGALGVPIITLYSQGRPIKINAKMLKDIDLLVFDIQDAGMRHYTYITTLFQAMEAAQQYNKKFVVLDRPNLLGPCMDGPLVESGFKSGISIASIPLRHGMTVGELALYFNRYIFQKPIELYVVTMKNYQRDSFACNQLISYLSSGIRNLNSCYCYSFLGLLGEIRPFYIGLGTKRRFQTIMLNEKIAFSMKRWKELQDMLHMFGIESFFCKQAGKKSLFRGLELSVKNVYNLESFKLLVRIVTFFKKSGVNIAFSKAFNIAVGTDKLRAFFDGKMKYQVFKKNVNKNLWKFYKKTQNCFLYSPFPEVKYL